MKCSKCGNEVNQGEKFCANCGEKIQNNISIINTFKTMFTNIKNKFKNMKKPLKISIILIPLILVIICICLPKNNVSKDNFKDSYLSTETHNGYKTFNFTIDDILKAYNVKNSDFSTHTSGVYCPEHSGTTSAHIYIKNKLTEEEKYLSEISIAYENKSKKVIYVEFYTQGASLTSLLIDYNIDITKNRDWEVISAQYLHQYAFKFVERLDKKYEWEKVFSDESKTKILAYKQNDMTAGQYTVIDNIGFLQCYTNPVGMMFRFIATDEEEFYNLSVNSLTNRLYDDEIYKVVELSNDTSNQVTNETENTTNSNSNNITGIEQAIQDGMIEEDYLTKGVTENELKFAYTDGNLQLYYDSWEDCLRDAKKLYILLPDEESSFNNFYTYFGGENNSKEDDIKEDITYLKAYNTSKMEGTSVYHIIRIYKYSNGELSYESYVCTYGEITSSVDCDFKFKTIEDALEHATECYTTNLKIEDLIEEDVTDESLFDPEFIGKYTSENKPIFIKAYNTLKLEEELSYHIIKLYEFSDGKFTYETYWNNYGSSILSRKSNYIKFNTIEEALKSATKSEQINMKTVEELTEE